MRKEENICQHRTEHVRLIALRKKCPFSGLFWSTFSRIQTEYGEIFCIFPYSVRTRENTDQNNPENEHFLRSATFLLNNCWNQDSLVSCNTNLVQIWRNKNDKVLLYLFSFPKINCFVFLISDWNFTLFICFVSDAFL